MMPILGLSMCTLSKECLNTKKVIGKYFNTSELGSTHYVELKSSGEFYHFYQNKDLILENIGSWKLEEKNCEIFFSLWKSFGEYQDKNCANGCSANVRLKNNALLFSYDLDEMNFTK